MISPLALVVVVEMEAQAAQVVMELLEVLEHPTSAHSLAVTLGEVAMAVKALEGAVEESEDREAEAEVAHHMV